MRKEEIEFEAEHDIQIAVLRIELDKACDIAAEILQAIKDGKIRHVTLERP